VPTDTFFWSLNIDVLYSVAIKTFHNLEKIWSKVVCRKHCSLLTQTGLGGDHAIPRYAGPTGAITLESRDWRVLICRTVHVLFSPSVSSPWMDWDLYSIGICFESRMAYRGYCSFFFARHSMWILEKSLQIQNDCLLSNPYLVSIHNLIPGSCTLYGEVIRKMACGCFRTPQWFCLARGILPC
jgi:hypothetical protein